MPLQDIILASVNDLRVTSREYTGPGLYVDFESLKTRLECQFNILDLYGEINLPNGLLLSAHIEIKDGRADFLEIGTFPLSDWDGNSDGFSIKN